VTPDDRRTFVASLTQQLGRLTRHPAPVGMSSIASASLPSSARVPHSARPPPSTSAPPPRSARPRPPKKVHIGILANNLTSHDMNELRNAVDQRLVHIDFFAKHQHDPAALREPTFYHIAIPESTAIARAVHAQDDTSLLRRCNVQRSRTLPMRATRPTSPASRKKAAEASSDDDEYDALPRCRRHVRSSNTEPGRIDLNPVLDTDEAFEEAMKAELNQVPVPRRVGSLKPCADCAAVARDAKAAEERLRSFRGNNPKRDGAKSKKPKPSRLGTHMPHLLAPPDTTSAMRVLPVAMRLRNLEAAIARLSPSAREDLHRVVQLRAAWAPVDSALPVPDSIARCGSVADCAVRNVAALADAVLGRVHPDDEDQRYETHLSDEDRAAQFRGRQQRRQREQYAVASVDATLSLEQFLRLVEQCAFEESRPTFTLSRRSRYPSGPTSGSAWEEIYAAFDVSHQQQVPRLAFLTALSALTQPPGDPDAAREFAVFASLVLLRVDGPLGTAEGGCRALTSSAVTLGEAFTVRDLLAAAAGMQHAPLMGFFADLEEHVVNGEGHLSAAEVVASVRAHFFPASTTPA
jgi:hypothetical protein